MGIGRLLLAAAAIAAMLPPSRAAAERIADWRPFVVEASRRFGVPVAWIERVMAAESGGRTRWRDRPIVSRAGAMGLMQLMPATWAEMRRAHGLGADPHAPRDNILAGAAYLRLMYDRFGYPGLFGAYNAGPGRYGEHLARGRPLPAETCAYVAAITADGSRPPAREARRDALFATLGTLPRDSATPIHGAPPRAPDTLLAASSGDGLFAVAPRR